MDADVGKKYLSRKQLAERYGVSVRTVERWEGDASLRFPKPIEINGRKYFDAGDIKTFEQSRVAAKAHAA